MEELEKKVDCLYDIIKSERKRKKELKMLKGFIIGVFATWFVFGFIAHLNERNSC